MAFLYNRNTVDCLVVVHQSLYSFNTDRKLTSYRIRYDSRV